MDCLLAIECQSPKLHCSWFLLVYTIHRAELTALRFALPPLGFHMKGLLTRRTFDLEAHQLPLSLSTQYCSSSGVPTSSLHDQVTDAIAILHWLRVPERVKFKLALMAYRVLNGMAPSYLINLFRYPALLVVAVYGCLSHCSCSSRHTVC